MSFFIPNMQINARLDDSQSNLNKEQADEIMDIACSSFSFAGGHLRRPMFHRAKTNLYCGDWAGSVFE